MIRRPSTTSSARLLAISSVLLGVTTAGCGTTADGLSVSWRKGPAAPVAAPSSLAQCPDISGVYSATGVVETTSTKTPRLPDLQALLAGPLAIEGLRAVPAPEAQTSPRQVRIERHGEGWRILGAGGVIGDLPFLNGAAEPLRSGPKSGPELYPDNRLFGVARYNGCARGRLWIAASSTRTQYENLNVTRAVAVLDPQADALHLTLSDQQENTGLLPWAWKTHALTRYRFDRVPAAAADTISTSPRP